jgi:hypothetical protein
MDLRRCFACRLAEPAWLGRLLRSRPGAERGRGISSQRVWGNEGPPTAAQPPPGHPQPLSTHCRCALLSHDIAHCPVAFLPGLHRTDTICTSSPFRAMVSGSLYFGTRGQLPEPALAVAANTHIHTYVHNARIGSWLPLSYQANAEHRSSATNAKCSFLGGLGPISRNRLSAPGARQGSASLAA